ncbi:hypothetical protein DV515_00013669 [Chloebia gouldiae]|uniref:Uncharacterized protein n=1 Tax=Chloebia gouldiae TaxID=44316 RepID=A0A3L8S0A2_CHLGU|nr:hypothetical protein DV515_00013669 [Chloebia gouldiae]
MQFRYSNLYLEGRNPAVGEERAGKSLSIQLGKHKFKSPDHVKTFCSQTRGSFGVYSCPPGRGCAEGLLAFGAVERFTAKIWRALACPCVSTEPSSWMSWFILLDPNSVLD